MCQQVCTLSVFAYFAASLLGAQFLIPPAGKLDNTTFPYSKINFSTEEPFIIHTPDLYFPIFTILEFIGKRGLSFLPPAHACFF